VTTCWVTGADGDPDFPLHNLPLGMFSPAGKDTRIGVAIGGYILDLRLAASHLGKAAALTSGDSLNALFAVGPGPRIELRKAVTTLLTGTPRPELLHSATSCKLHLPVAVGDYTDFYAGIHHATAVGKLFRPDSPLLPNCKYVPIGYHGRASSVQPSSIPVWRPQGQRKPADGTAPTLGPSHNLDYELELGIWVGTGNCSCRVKTGSPALPVLSFPFPRDRRKFGGQAAIATGGHRSLAGWNFCSKPEPSVPL